MNEGWSNSNLPRLLVKMKSGGTPETSKSEFYSGDIPFAAIDDLTSCSRFLSKTKKSITQEGLRSSNTWLVPEGSILYSIYATLGVPRINTVPLTTNQAILGMVHNPDLINRDYLFYWLTSIRNSVLNLSSQTTQSNLSSSVVKSFVVRHPASLEEQTKIAEILSTVDRAIEQTEALIAKQQRIKTGLMQDLLTRGIDEHGNLRSEATHEFKDSPLGRIPVEWEVKTIESLLAEVDPAMRSGPFGSALLKEELVEQGIPLLGIDNVFPEKFVSEFTRFVTPKKADQLKRYLVRPADLMITIMGTVGRCCMVPDNIGAALSSKHVWTISIDSEKCSPYLACYQINHSAWVLDHFRRDEQGGVMGSIKSDTLRSTKLMVPPPRESASIEENLQRHNFFILQYQKNLSKLSSLKTSLMQDLLTGKKRVDPLLQKQSSRNENGN